MVETIRSVTALPIAVDANQGWKDKHQALEMIHWLKEKGIVMIEQPMSKYLRRYSLAYRRKSGFPFLPTNQSSDCMMW